VFPTAQNRGSVSYRFLPRVILFEGFAATNGGFAGRAFEAFAVGTRRMTDEAHLPRDVASKIVDVYKRRDRVNYGLDVVKAPAVKGLKHFLAQLQPVSLQVSRPGTEPFGFRAF